MDLSAILSKLPAVKSPSRAPEIKKVNRQVDQPIVYREEPVEQKENLPLFRPILKSHLSPTRSPGRVEFGAPQIQKIPGRKTLAKEARIPLPIQHNVPLPYNTSPHGDLVGNICSTTGLMIIGDPEEFFEYFHQFSTWEEFVESLNDDTYQWTGAPDVSGSIIRLKGNVNRCLKLYATKDKQNLYLE
jgi:hypothetical protein